MTFWHTLLLGMFNQQQQKEENEKSMPKMYILFITEHVFLSNAPFLWVFLSFLKCKICLKIILH